MAGAAGLGDDALHLLDLALGAGEGSELERVVLAFFFLAWMGASPWGGEVASDIYPYPLLGELTGALVLAVAEELDDAALVGGEAGDLLDDVADESGALAQVALGPADAGLDDAGGGFLFFGGR